MPIFFPKGWPSLYKESSTQGLKGCSCLKDQLTNSQGNSRRPLNWEEEGPGRGWQNFVNWHCLVQCSLTFSRQHLAAFPWQLGQRARLCLLKPLPRPLGMDDTTKLCSDRKLDPSLSLLPSTLDCIEPSLSAAKFGSTLLMATWQALSPRTETSKYPDVPVTAVLQPST